MLGKSLGSNNATNVGVKHARAAMLLRAGTAPTVEHPMPGNGETRAWAIADVLDAALTTTGAEAAEIFLREGPQDSGVSLAGYRGPFRDAFYQITHFEDGQGYPGLVTGQGHPLQINDAVGDGRFLRTQVKELGFRYFLCVPIPGREGPVGSLDVAWRAGSDSVFSHCLTLSREAERLGLILEHEVNGQHEDALAPGTAVAQRLDLRMLGRFEARRGGVLLSLDAFARRRAVALLKILLTNYGRSVVRDELIDLLWPEDPPKEAANLLKIAVHYLRRGLGEAENARGAASFISTESNGYAFNVESFHKFDVAQFETTAEVGFHYERQGRWREALTALRAAADLYAGDYLEDDPYGDWCSRRRRQLRETLFEVLLATGRLHRTVGDLEASARSYRRVLELDPCLEEVHRELMDVLCRCGKRTQALRQFEACRKALRDEFDVAPAIETEALYRSILGRLSG